VRLVQIDAFADREFSGNPAAVMPLERWLPDAVLQAIAEENNLSETAFLVRQLPSAAGQPPIGSPGYHLRWFTPAVEVDLCGHATLAAAAHLFDDVHPQAEGLAFWTRSGWLQVTRGTSAGHLDMDFPAEALLELPADDPVSAAAVAALGVRPLACLRGTDLAFVLADEAAVLAATPDHGALAQLPVRGVIITAKADRPDVDFVSRWFGGAAGVREDPVTGSAHSQMAPYWAGRLGRTALTARQLSRRGGTVRCEVRGERVRLSGSYRRYLDGTATIADPAE
jgi:PhzF family phenazine biosynthesis protein